MNKAALTLVDERNATLSGVVDFDTVPALYDQLITWLPKASDVTVSLQDVVSCNSAALAMIVELKADALKIGTSVSFVHVPKELEDLAHLSCNALHLI
jgi:phospholipid transport system transporter-binding protein